MRCWITRENDSYWMITRNKPIIARMARVGARRAYVPPGDPLGFRFICKFVASMFYDKAEEMEILESVPLTAHIAGQRRVVDDDTTDAV